MTPPSRSRTRFRAIAEDVDMSSTNQPPPSSSSSSSSSSPPTSPGIPTGTSSTDSTKTLRGPLSPSKSSHPLRTPSYPFPSMHTPQLLGTDVHRPFTALSPTIPPPPPPPPFSRPYAPEEGWGDTLASIGAAQMSSMKSIPEGMTKLKDASDFPTPPLEEVLLMLTSEPGMDAWWKTVVRLMQVTYKAHRLSLAVPADSTDLQNVPWGQKATFNVAENDTDSLVYLQRSIIIPPSTEGSASVRGEEPETDRRTEDRPPPPPPPPPRPPRRGPTGRPKLEYRHSFAGFGRETYTAASSLAPASDQRTQRPGPARTRSFISTQPANLDPTHRHRPALSSESLRKHTMQAHGSEVERDRDKEKVPLMKSGEARPRVLPVLQALDYEADPLIDGAGVNKVLERGRIVVLSREYNTSTGSSVRSMGSERHSYAGTERRSGSSYRGSSARKRRKTGEWIAKVDQPPMPSSRPAGTDEQDPTVSRVTNYEDFEQESTSSPWSRSPAPSPAVITEGTEYPFFAEATVDEGCFKAASAPSEDYSTQSQVEAIGLDRSSSIIHIPLIHPLLSRSSATPRAEPSSAPRGPVSFFHEDFQTSQSAAGTLGEAGWEQKSPVGILTILTSIVPSPSNMIQFLGRLAPHLATTFSLAQQYTSVESQVASLSRRGWRLPSSNTNTEHISDSRQFDEFVRFEVNPSPGLGRTDAASAIESLTSPSEFSMGSPGDSVVGTPGLESSAFGSLNDRRISGGTPAQTSGTDIVEGYFQTRRPQASGHNDNSTAPRSGEATASQARQHPEVHRRDPSRHGTDRTGRANEERLTVGETSAQPHPQLAPLEALSASVARLGITEETGGGHSTSGPGGQAHRPRQSAGTAAPVQGSSSVLRATEPSISEEQRTTSTSRPQRGAGHTLLHSYGADFAATFQSLPTASSTIYQQHAVGGRHRRSPSDSGQSAFEMPPPSERLLRTIIDAVPVQIFTVAPQNGNITWVNSKFLTYRGHSVQDFMKDPWQSIDPEQREDYLNAWSQSLKNGEQFSYRVRLRRFDGAYRWFYVRAAPLRDRRGVTVHWFGTNMDIHEQHVAELSSTRQREIAVSESKYRALANSSPQIVFAATETKGIIFANTQWVTYSGQQFDEALGLRFTDHVHPEDLAKCKLPGFVSNPEGAAPFSSFSKNESNTTISSSASSNVSNSTDGTITDRRPVQPETNLVTTARELVEEDRLKISLDEDGRPCYSTELRLKSKDGEYRWHLVRCTLVDSINFGNGEASWFGTCTDINDHKLMEQKMKEAMDLQTRFLSNMSHEIRTPLIGISGMVEFLYHTPLNSEQLDYCDTIWSSSAGLLAIVNDILDLSKIEAGMMSLTSDWFHIRSTIEAVNDALSAQAINKGLELNYIVEDDVPPTVKGDQARIRQVLMNLLGNAVKFTNQGEVLAHCKVHKDDGINLAENEIMLSFEVIDTGLGFSKKDGELMFKPFSQIIGSNTRQYGGSGLGLVISRQLVELHGGKMTSSSVPGKGSTFTFVAKFVLPDTEKGQSTMEPSASSNAQQEITELIHQPMSPYLSTGFTQSPAAVGTMPAESQESPAVTSSTGSDYSARSGRTFHSERSSMSSFLPAFAAHEAIYQRGARVQLSLRRGGSEDSGTTSSSSPTTSSLARFPRRSSLSDAALHPPLYSILIVCPQPYSLQAITRHIDTSLPKEIPRQVTPRAEVLECQRMLGGDHPVIFTHVALNLADPDEVLAVMDQILQSNSLGQTSIVVIADAKMRNEIKKRAKERGLASADQERRVHFLHKPVKPSRVAELFDPETERRDSTDRIRRSAERHNDRRRLVFTETEKSVGHKGYRVLLVEDNPTNQKVLGMFLHKVGVDVEIAADGVECIQKIFSNGHKYYSIVLCDLQMPNKDGYQTCREIRQWEQEQGLFKMPIVALSANVVGDVLDRCTEAGFNTYLSKPVEFKALSATLTELMVPSSRPKELLR
ncbi:MAG: hypothetical protein M1816_000868 [Peltula sp. TS41687]|nr:MAG: hypothetical protein M1816_000868 [Peltula sp. TS41687]